MWDVSDRWDGAVRVAHSVATLVEVWQNGSLVQTINADGGTVTIDEGSKVRRALSLSCTDVALTPLQAADLLAPFGTELHVYSGITYTSGDTEYVPLGVFPITTASRSGIFTNLTITADDYSKVLDDNRFVTPWQTPAGSPLLTEVSRIVNDVYPSVAIYDLSGSTLLTTAASWTGSRIDAINALVTACGCEFIFDQLGRGIIRSVPTVDGSASVWKVDANNPSAVMTDVATSLSVEGVYNAVVATSSAAGVTPVSAIVYQSSGPMAWRAGFKRPRFYASPLITTVAQCEMAAQSILALSSAYSRDVSPVAVPNPALDAGDLIDVTLPDGSVEQRVVTKIDLPLNLAEMKISTRVNPIMTTTTNSGTLT